MECGSSLPLSVRPACWQWLCRQSRASKLAERKRQRAAALQSACGARRSQSLCQKWTTGKRVSSRRKGSSTLARAGPFAGRHAFTYFGLSAIRASTVRMDVLAGKDGAVKESPQNGKDGQQATRPLRAGCACRAGSCFASQVTRARCMSGLRQRAPKIPAATLPWRGARSVGWPDRVRAPPGGTSARSHP